MREWTVGVFEHERTSGRMFLMAYVRDYNPQWKGCCVHRTIADDGSSAKENAKAQHRRECMAGRAPEESVTSEQQKRCEAWQKAGETLRASVAWRLYQGKGDVLSVVTGVPYTALETFVETGELDHVHRMVLEVAAG